MSDLKSKLPDFKEVSSIATKLFKDVRASVSEIITDFKKKRSEENTAEVGTNANAGEKADAAAKTPASKKAKEKTAEKSEGSDSE